MKGLRKSRESRVQLGFLIPRGGAVLVRLPLRFPILPLNDLNSPTLRQVVCGEWCHGRLLLDSFGILFQRWANKRQDEYQCQCWDDLLPLALLRQSASPVAKASSDILSIVR